MSEHKCCGCGWTLVSADDGATFTCPGCTATFRPVIPLVCVKGGSSDALSTKESRCAGGVRPAEAGKLAASYCNVAQKTRIGGREMPDASTAARDGCVTPIEETLNRLVKRAEILSRRTHGVAEHLLGELPPTPPSNVVQETLPGGHLGEWLGKLQRVHGLLTEAGRAVERLQIECGIDPVKED